MKAIILLIILSGIYSRDLIMSSKFTKEKTGLYFDNKTIDFGVLINDTIIKARYNFKNISDSTIFITDYSASCFCTDIIVSKDTILVGENGYVELFGCTTKPTIFIKNGVTN